MIKHAEAFYGPVYTTPMTPEKVIAYYDYTVPFYKVFWHGKTNALHYGLWDEDTSTIREALLNENRVLAELARIAPHESILDAGCGVGGSALWLAEHAGANVTGITLSPRQKEKAEKYARQRNLESRPTFLVRDFLNTGFPDNTFDVVWSIESVCHAEDKSAFLKESYRILKPGGRIIMADGFLKRAPQNEREEQAYRTFLRGFVLPNVALIEAFQSSLAETGFRNVRGWDKTQNILPSSRRMLRLSIGLYPPHFILTKLRIVPPLILDTIRTGLVQYSFFKNGPGGYFILYGEK